VADQARQAAADQQAMAAFRQDRSRAVEELGARDAELRGRAAAVEAAEAAVAEQLAALEEGAAALEGQRAAVAAAQREVAEARAAATKDAEVNVFFGEGGHPFGLRVCCQCHALIYVNDL
jgi:hypothetical protein